jgi:hypothetical protein
MMRIVQKTVGLLLAAALLFTAAGPAMLLTDAPATPAADTATVTPGKTALTNTDEPKTIRGVGIDTVTLDKPAAVSEVLTACGGECAHYPTIVGPGIGQGQVFLLDDEGNRIINPDGSAATAWPIQVDADSLIKKLVLQIGRAHV